MQLATPHLLLLLIPLAGLSLLLWLHLRRMEKRLSEFIQDSLLPSLLKHSTSSFTQKRQLTICSIAVSLLVLALAQPQWGFIWKERTSSGVDLVIAVDVSSSMLATDIKPTRLEQARREIIDLLGELKGDRVGLVSFAGVAFTESPLTLDYSAFKLFLNSLNPDLLPVGGTNIEAALTESIRVLEQVSSNSRARAIVLITDGEEFDGNASGLFKRLEEMNVRLYVLGIGTVEGAPIPSSKGYKKSKDGSVIVSRLHPELLEKLAKDSGGVYVQSVVSDSDIRELYDNGIRKQLQAKSLEWGSAKRWNEYFQAPLLLAILLMLYCWAPGLRKANATNSPVVILLFSLLACLSPSNTVYAQSISADQVDNAQDVEQPNSNNNSKSTNLGRTHPNSKSPEELEELGAQASQKFGNAEFEDALNSFETAVHSKNVDSRFLIGKAASLYRLGKFEQAAKAFIEAAEMSSFGKRKAEQLYNAANSLAQVERYKEALELYSKALEISPDDREMLDNRNYVKKLVQQQENKDDKNEQSDKEKGSKKKQDQNKHDKDNKNKQNQRKQDESNQDQNKNQERDQHKQDEDKTSKNEKTKDAQGDKNEKDKEKQDSKENEQQSQNSEQKLKEGSDSNKDAKKEDLSSEEIMQLRSVQEQRGAQVEFRAKKAIEQLKQLKQKIPQKDW